MTKLCSKCKTEPKAASNSYCKKCHSEYQVAYYKRTPSARYEVAAAGKRRKAALREIIHAAKAVPCADCGKQYPYYVMDFDHVRGKKLMNIAVAQTRRMSPAKVRAEIAKCEVVCSNCHRIRTFTDRPKQDARL